MTRMVMTMMMMTMTGVVVRKTTSLMTSFLVTSQLLLCFFSLLLPAEGAQRFVERPQNTSVIEGQTVILRCLVADRVGDVQWVKDGFALGFDPAIPGYPTYSLLSGEPRMFNLMIANSQLSDDAEYQCQVTPGGPAHPRLTATAYLTVYVPCAPPVIEGYENGSAVEVPYTRRSLSLVCRARHGRPAAQLTWLRNGEIVTGNSVEYHTQPVAPGDKRSDASSTLTLTLHGDSDNDATYTCLANNSAIMGPPLAAVVTINILYPPGEPVITGYTDGQVVRTNGTVILSCSSTGGRPLATVVWFRGARRVDSSFTSGGNRAINEYTFRATPLDNGVEYRCEVTNLVTASPLTASFTLTVHFPPTGVAITGPRSRSLRAGDNMRLTCKTSHCNPRATVTWFARGRQIPSRDVTNSYEASPNGGWETVSRVRVTLTQQDHNVIYTCQATNDLGQTVADTVTVSVLYPPSAPTISGHVEGGQLRANQLERLICRAVGGNPLAVLKWYKNGELLSNAQYKVIGNIAQSEIGIVARPDDNGAVYKCTATSEATSQPLETSITTSVLFPPASVNITTSTSQPTAGQGMNLTCVSASSNPAAEITWLKGGRRVQGVNRGVVDGVHGGKKTTSVLHIIATSSDHNAQYACQATNTLLALSVTDSVTLTALFPPEFRVPSGQHLELTAGDRRTLNVSAYANPTQINYTLRRNGRPFSKFRISDEGQLTISNIKKNHGGNFTVTAQNSQGSATLTFTIHVKYGASITYVSPRIMADEGGTANLTCEAEADPVTSDMVRWTRSGFDMVGRTRQTRTAGRAVLTVVNLTRSDIGSFTCVADNGIDRPDSEQTRLLVTYAPEVDKSPARGKAAGDIGGRSELTCRAQGVPDITFSWTKGERTLGSTSNKYSISSRSSGDVSHMSTLKIKNIDSQDYGVYTCTATNTKGSDAFNVSLSVTGKPDPPYDLQFVNATHDTITISWQPGFNGGQPQSFRVRYKPVKARGYVYVDVPPPAIPTFTMTGLRLDTEYEMTVLAFNTLGESDFLPTQLKARTASTITRPDLDISTSELESDDVPVLIILIVCIVAVFLLTLNVGLILFFIRRKKRLENGSSTASHTNTFELYGPTKPEAAQLFPVTMTDDTRSYGTYDKSMDDDLSDDYDNEYEEYSGGHFNRMDDRHSPPPWVKDPYRISMSKQGLCDDDDDDDLYDNRVFPQDNRPKGIMELAERSPFRGGASDMDPRHYGSRDVQPRYAPAPGALSINNPHYSGPPAPAPAPSQLTSGSRRAGHMV